MKLVKKILRLLPLLFMLGAMIASIVFNNNLNVGEYNTPMYYFEFEMGAWDGFNDSLRIVINNTPFETLHDWFYNNISNSYLLSWSICILVYELYLSLAFLMFDFINMVFGWANKLIDKGANSVE